MSHEAFAVVKANRHLYGFAIRAGVGAAASLLVLGVVGGGIALALEDDLGSGVAIALLVVGALVAACVVARFQGGMVAAADTALRGEASSYGQGMQDSSGRTGTLAAWGLINGTVGLVLGAIQGGSSSDGIAGVVASILSALVQLAWAAITFFVVPVIVFEHLGAIGSIKRSTSILKAKWGTAVSGVVHIGVRLAFYFYLPGILLIAGGLWLAISGDDPATITLGSLVVAVGVILCIVGGVVNSTVRSVFSVALYRYAIDGQALGPFDAEQLQASMRLKGEKRGRATA